jgi:site-specific DNA recombinase
VRRELPKDRWVVLDHPGLRIVPQELWDAAKARQRALGTGSSIPGTHKRNQRLLSGLLICGKCGARLTLRGGNTYACAAHRDRGDAVCDSTVIVNARAAEQALLEVVTDVLYGEDLLSGIAERVRSKMVAVRQQQSDGGEQSSIQEQLAQVEQRIQNLADSIEQMGPLEDLKARFAQACNRREGLRADLALLQSNTSETDLSFIPDAVHAYAQRLPALLESGRMEEVKEGLISLVSRIEAYEAPDLANGKPGARLLFQGNLVGTVDLLGGKVKIVNSPGGLLPPLRFQPPPRRIKLYLLRGRGSGRDAAEPRRAATHG